MAVLDVYEDGLSTCNYLHRLIKHAVPTVKEIFILVFLSSCIGYKLVYVNCSNIKFTFFLFSIAI